MVEPVDGSAAGGERDEAEATEAGEPVRLRRIRQFLVTHLVLCVLVLAAAIVERVLELSDPEYFYNSLAAVLVPTALVLAGFVALRRGLLVNYLIPGILMIDSVLVIKQVVLEGGLESGWAATPVLLIIMMPLFSHRRWQVWLLAGVQMALFGLAFLARGMGWLDYDLRPGIADDPAYQVYTGMGYVFLIVAAAILAGRTSVDVVNSQRQLRDEAERATAALREVQARLVQHEKMVGLGQLTAGVAHEINNPLTFVTTNITSLERDILDVLALLESYAALDETLADVAPAAMAEITALRDDLYIDEPREVLGELLADTRDGLARVQQIIRDLKTFARLDEAERKRVDVHEGLESSLKMLRHKLYGVAEIERVYGELPEVDAFPALLNQVFMNLLQNAFDVLPREGGRIAVRTRQVARELIIEVADNGPGVPDDLRGRIFDPFFTTKEVGTGTGLGLSLSYRIIDRHGGRLEVDDDAELGGALFRVAIPIDRVDTTRPAPMPAV